MATKMEMADLELVTAEHPNAQKVAVLNAPYDISIAHARIPEPDPDEIRLRVVWVGICGSDLEAYRGLQIA
jgi:threonine dehydrogenase-like Zn-dependent dehydrogenase